MPGSRSVDEPDTPSCSACGRYIQDEDWITIQQGHPWGDTVAYETIAVGYKCPCGHQEDW